MITIDANATDRLRSFGHAERHPLLEAGRLSRIVGMDVVRMPDGALALGKTAYDGSWSVILREGADLLDEAGSALWRSGRVCGRGGNGFLMADPASLGEAFGAMIRLPSPMLDDGSVVEADLSEPGDAALAVEAALSPMRP